MPTENTIIAVFPNSADAEAAATDLEAAGISREDIYVDSVDTGPEKSSRSKTTSREGGFAGWWKSLFGDDDDADRSEYEAAIRRGNCLLRVDADGDEIPVVEDVLNRHSPIDVHAEARAAAGQASATVSTGRAAPATQGKTDAIPVVKEEIQVGKRQVLRGAIRIYSRVVEEPVEETMQLREERVRVERQPVDRPATEADLSGGREQVVEVQEFAEEPVVAKQARVVEEVRVKKDVSERTETVRDKVRHTDVNVERTAGDGEAQVDDSDFRSDFEKRYAASGARYETYLPAYRYGYQMASDPRYQGRSFDEVESDLRTDYGRQYPNSAWEKMKDAIRYGWNRVTGKAKAAAR